MAGSPRTPLLLLAVLALALALAVSPAAGQGVRKKGLVGGLMEADVNEKGVQEALSFAIREYNKQSNDAYQSRAVRVVRAFKQVPSSLLLSSVTLAHWPHGEADSRGIMGLPGCVRDELLLGRGDWPNHVHKVPGQLGQLSLP
ncbi:cystatin-C isoform X2 [Phocoena sinus]|uniref:cystatin-C isoform X2 n=1 Tax=Phocoena sinus TaxID=42100 RepID=UPI0013C452CA|nr:cystatin-C isoform X2 [Phocoena sinus]